MASAYPGGLDSFATNKADATTTPTDHPTHHNDLADAVNKIEAELGVDPAGSAATVVARLNAIGLSAFVPFIAGSATSGLQWTNMPSAETELQGRTSYRRIIDMRGFTNARICVSMGGNDGATNAVLKAQYSANSGSTWADLTTGASINTIDVVTVSTSSTIPAPAKIQSCWLRIVGVDGDGVKDPNITGITLELT